jgi:putative membrane protein (TIGR04086 family)
MEKQNVKIAVLDILRGLIIALIINVVAVLIIALVVKYTGISTSAATIINQVVKVLSVALGIICGFRSRKHGWLLGAAVGLLYTLIGFGTFSLLAGKRLLAEVTVFDFLINGAAGAFAGILAVNLRSIERTPRTPRRLKRQH